MDAFKLRKDGKILDYRVGKKLDLEDIRLEFEKEFHVVTLQQEGRHVIGVLQKNGQELILKLATTEGISARTETDKLWNDEFNKYSQNAKLRVPKNFAAGFYQNLYYIIEEKFDGPHLCKLDGTGNFIEENLELVINFSELIQALQVEIPANDLIEAESHTDWLVAKAKTWLSAIPAPIASECQCPHLFEIVSLGSKTLARKPRHGDFTPWHLIKFADNSLALIDGEHAHSNGVEYYDICYFIQRVHSILGKPEQAIKIFRKLIARGYDKEKLRTVLASRAIGGFLDASLNPAADYNREIEFKDWVINL